MEIGILLNAEIEECYWQFVDALKTGNLAVLKIHGMVGILTTETISTALRDGKEGTAHARQVAIFIKKGKVITLTYFQSTNIVSNT